MTESSVAAMKSRLRDIAKARRAEIDPEQRRFLSNDAARRLNSFLAPLQATDVSAFLSIGEELNTAPAIESAIGAGHRVALPVMQGKGRPLLFRQYQLGDSLQTVQWGIREPQPTAALIDPEVLLVPLLAFDGSGNRLGYGGGYYDRTIRDLRRRRTIVTIGLAFDEQEVDVVPHLDYDERLDWIITPTRTLSFPG